MGVVILGEGIWLVYDECGEVLKVGFVCVGL